jgi:acyl-CoA synthetase (AMP-forming)/AMP-acid ligase II
VRPDACAFSFLEHGERETARLSFSELHRQAMGVAMRLRQGDFEGRPVMLIYPPGLDYIVAFCGCLHAGAIAVPVPYLLPRRAAERIAAIAAQAELAAVLTTARLAGDPALRGAMDGSLAAAPWIATDDLAPVDADAEAWAPPDPQSLAFLQYTSGSTSAPKGVAISQANLMANQAMIRQAFGHDEHTRFVNWLPIFHDMGLVGGVLQPLFLGIPCVMMSPLAFLQKPVRWLRAIADHRATTSGAPNFAYALCARNIRPEQLDGLDLTSWSVAFCGAEPVRGDVLSRFAEALAPTGFRREALYPCYGLAEVTLFVTGGPPGTGARTVVVDGDTLAQDARAAPASPGQASARTLVSCGPGWDGQQLDIVEPETGQRLGPGQVGEIWIAGPHVGQGYWRAPEESARVFQARLAEGDAAPRLRTGDLGFLQDGELFVTGRLKDLLIVRGAKHHPEEIEATVARSHPALAGDGGAVFMIDDDEAGRVIVLHEVERRSLAGLDADAVALAAFGAVTGQHGIRPDDLVLLRPGTLPRTTSGKIQRHKARLAYQSGALSPLPLSGWPPRAAEERPGRD